MCNRNSLINEASSEQTKKYNNNNNKNQQQQKKKPTKRNGCCMREAAMRDDTQIMPLHSAVVFAGFSFVEKLFDRSHVFICNMCPALLCFWLWLLLLLIIHN